jgi:hypothetical protein
MTATKADIANWKKKHHLSVGDRCFFCNEPWPCMTAEFIDLRAENERLRNVLDLIASGECGMPYGHLDEPSCAVAQAKEALGGDA